MVTRIRSKTSVVATIVAMAVSLLVGPATSASATDGGSMPEAIAAGPDGNMWFTQMNPSNRLGRITTAGDITEFTVPDSFGAHRWGIAAGPDGNMWFTQTFGTNGIGRITPTGVVTQYPVNNAAPAGIAAGPDGNMWWVGEGMIGKISLTGEITEYPLPQPGGYNFSANGIAAGPDGNMWFTQVGRNRIGRITPDGVITQYALSTPWSRPVGIAAGPDGNMWFTMSGTNRIGRISPDGTITEFPLPSASDSSHGIAAGPDGNMWFTSAYKIGRVTPAGTITEYPLVKSGSSPHGIAAGPDGNMWFTEPEGNRIGRITLDGVVTEFAITDPPVTKTACPINVTLHQPIPKRVGKRVLTDGITTDPSGCGLRKPVVLCRPLASAAAGEKAFCLTKVTTRGKIRVNTRGYEAIRVTAIVRATPTLDHTDLWKPDTWRRNWVLKRTTAGMPGQTTLTLSRELIQRMEAADVDIIAIGGATLSASGVATFGVTGRTGPVIPHKGGLRFSSAAGFVTLENIAVNYKTGTVTAFVKAPATPGGIEIPGVLTFAGGKQQLKRDGTWDNATVALAMSTSLGNPAPLFASQLGLPASSIPTGMTIGKARITLHK